MAHIVFVDAGDSTFWTMERALERGHRVTFVRPNDSRWYSKNITTIRVTQNVEVKPVETVASARSVSCALADIGAQQSIDAVINSVDPTIEYTAEACRRLGIRFTSVQGVRTARNKRAMRQAAEEIPSSPIVLQAVVHDLDSAAVEAERVGYPVVMKPVSGFGSLLARRLDTPLQLKEYASYAFRAITRLPNSLGDIAARGLLVEKYVTGDIVSVELFASESGWLPLLVNGLALAEGNECIGLGTIVPAPITSVEQTDCFLMAEAACRACGLDCGVFHIELLLTPTGPVLLEINPRMMGGVMTHAYFLATGQSFHDFVLAAHLNDPPPLVSSPTRTVVTRKLLALQSSTIPAHLSKAALSSRSSLAAFFNYNIVPGRDVSPEDTLARCLVTGETYEAAVASAEAVRSSFQDQLGFCLQRPLLVNQRHDQIG